MILVRYYGSNNGRAHDTLAIQAGTAAASVREGRDVCVAADHKGEQVTMYYYGDVAAAGHKANGTTEIHTARWSYGHEASHSPTAPYTPRFQPPTGCWRAQTTEHSQLTASSDIRRAPAGHHSPHRDVALPRTLSPPPGT